MRNPGRAHRITGRGRRAATPPRAVVAGVQSGGAGKPPAGRRAKALTDGDSDGKGGDRRENDLRLATAGRGFLLAGNLVVGAG